MATGKSKEQGGGPGDSGSQVHTATATIEKYDTLLAKASDVSGGIHEVRVALDKAGDRGGPALAIEAARAVAKLALLELEQERLIDILREGSARSRAALERWQRERGDTE